MQVNSGIAFDTIWTLNNVLLIVRQSPAFLAWGPSGWVNEAHDPKMSSNFFATIIYNEFQLHMVCFISRESNLVCIISQNEEKFDVKKYEIYTTLLWDIGGANFDGTPNAQWIFFLLSSSRCQKPFIHWSKWCYETALEFF